MESSSNSIAKKLLHMFKVVYYMLRKGIISKRKLMMDLHLLLKCGKLAGKALGNLMTIHGHHHHHTDNYSSSRAYSSSSFSCMSMDPNHSFYDPREVEFSCSNTPSYPVNITRRKNHHHRSNKNYSYDYEAVAAIAKAFEMLNKSSNNTAADMSDSESVLPSPSPMIAFGKSPAKMVRQLRITDSPFPIKEDEVADGRVDKEADEFIRRFYEQLRMQPATPEYRLRRGA